MGSKVDSYVDGYGNIIKDGDIVIYKGSEYKVIYISNYYVNMEGSGGLHLPFNVGVPYLKNGATKSPVKITTVTKKEIVPGTYGRLHVVNSNDKYVTLGFSFDSTLDKTELAEAIKTLQEIYDCQWG